MPEDSAYRRMLEGKITSQRYARELKKQVRRARHADKRTAASRSRTARNGRTRT